MFINGGKRCRERICVRACLFCILNNEMLRKVIVRTRKIISPNNTMDYPHLQWAWVSTSWSKRTVKAAWNAARLPYDGLALTA